MVDHTIYFDDDHTPELAVRQIFGRQRSPAKLCLLFAGLGLLTLDRIAHLGEDPATVRRTFARIIDGDDKLGSQLAKQEGNCSQFLQSGNPARGWSSLPLVATPKPLRIL